MKTSSVKISEIMTPDPVILEGSVPVAEAARAMREYNIGDVVVKRNGELCGIVTDRDITIRVIGDGKDPKKTTLDSVCSHEVLTVSPDQKASDAVQLMRSQAIRRLPVVQHNHVLGIVSLGDLAVALDRPSALGNISAAAPNL